MTLLSFILLCLCTFAFLFSPAAATADAQNVMPAIGILGLPADQACDSFLQPEATVPSGVASCFTSFYAKFIEAGGGRVVPLPASLDAAQVASLATKLNGVLFTGGELNLTLSSAYVRTAEAFVAESLAAANRGETFPVWGTCQGMQLLSVIGAQSTGVLLAGFDSERLSLPLDFAPAAAHSSLYGPQGLPPAAVRALATEPITSNLHHDGVPPSMFNDPRFAKLGKMFTVLSTNKDRNGREFVSSIEAKNAPIFGVQFHPERSLFEWAPDYNISHTRAAKRTMQAFANFLVEKAAESRNSFAPGELDKLVIENLSPKYSGQKLYSMYYY